MSKNFLIANKLLKRTFISKVIGKNWNRKYELNLRTSVFISHIDLKPFLIDYYSRKDIKDICRKYLDHQFNFLGTGWTCWNKDKTKKNIIEYEKIAWDEDIVTGYRFVDKYFSSNLISSLPEGIDVKIPWELGRMNHFPFMAMCAVNNKNLKTIVLEEFVNQITNLIQQSPIGIGVQYYCPMDVGIRCINLLFSYDILLQIDSDGIFDKKFSLKFENYILSLGNYISQNLEYNFVRKTSGNHFLCDIAALLWICAYFDNIISATWYKECKTIFYREIEKQFLPGGSNYECSSGYHRLSCEIVAMGIIAIEWKDGNLDCNRVISDRLQGMANLLEILRGRDGNMIQIGDMDSGFILKLIPHYIGDSENTLSVDYVLGILHGIIYRSNTEINSIDYYVAECVFKGFSVKGIVNGREQEGIFEENCINKKNIKEYERFIKEAEFVYQHNVPLEHTGYFKGILHNDEFGIIKVIYDQADVYIRVIPDYRKMELAHVHDDVFHYEIVYSTHRWHPDSGSVNYTADIELRNYYAANESHNTVIHKIPIIRRDGVFSASSLFKGEFSYDDRSVYLCVTGPYKHIRKFIFFEKFIMIIDASHDSFEVNVKDASYSLGYGQIYESKVM